MKQNKNLFIGIVIGALISGVLSFFILNKLSKAQVHFQQMQITEQAELIDSIRHSGMAILLCNILDKVDAELATNPKRLLSDETIARIAAVSYSLISHIQNDSDSVPGKIVSPERGELLLMLSKMKIDSASLKKIMLQTSFAGAVLRDADLKQADLTGVDLKGADLENANLENANLYEANLRSANLWGSNLNAAILNGADLTRANLAWSDLSGADLKRAELYGAILNSAQLRKADLQGVNLQWADLIGTFLTESNLGGANLFRANLNRANLEKTNLSNAKLTLSTLTEANIEGANLTGTELTSAVLNEKNWLTLLDAWSVIGAKEILSKYKMAAESPKNPLQYRLEKIKD
ncbi:MAG: pentapeptide repeat-containing protein [Saprospiraceae bacterium]